MEEIKENEYIRTTQGTIARIEDTEFDICYNTFNQLLYKNWIMSECFYEEIVKHSSNVLDLLEVGDVVTHGEETIFITAFESEEQLDYFINLYKHENLSIKSIVTKEQFALAEYKVKE